MPREPLRIARVTVREARLPFRISFRHAAATRREAHVLFVEVVSTRGVSGFGEILTRTYLTGETIDSALGTLKNQLIPAVFGLRFTADRMPNETLAKLYETADANGQTAAYAGLDVAIFDLWARTFEIPGESMLGKVVGDARPLTAPIGFGLPAGPAAWAAKRLGFETLKLKVGRDFEGDIRRVAAARKAVGYRFALRVDANGAWTPEEAAKALPRLWALDVQAVEQPVSRADTAHFGALARATKSTIVADESLAFLRDAQDLAQQDKRIEWNLRLAKVGGFSGILALARLADGLGISYQLGALVGESTLLTSALRACLGALHPTAVECSYPDWLLRHDPFLAAHPSRRLSHIAPLGRTPGLGVTPHRVSFTRLPIVLDTMGSDPLIQESDIKAVP